MRKAPDFSPPAVKLRPRDDVQETTIEYELITPLFGGGVTPQQADPITKVRASSVVGHLRFWWRACRGARFAGDLTAMRAAEDALWGSTEIPSPIVIDLRLLKAGAEAHPFVVDANQSGRPKLVSRSEVAPAYVAFPMQPPQNEMRVGMKTAAVVRGVSFELRLRYPRDVAADVEAALWAWETFGGIGGRTRRGFGALKRTKTDGKAVALPRSSEILARLQADVKKHVLPVTALGPVPLLNFDFLFSPDKEKQHVKVVPKRDPMDAWRHIIERYREFRQQRNPGNAPGRPGRSHWPEPDAIRRLTKQSSAPHSSPLSDVDAFPRALLGLPIIFHFKDVGDPGDSSLQGTEGFDRLASPLILRPLATSDGAVGLAAVLYCSRVPPGGLRLVRRGGSHPVSPVPADRAQMPKIRALSGGTPPTVRYPIEAFLAYL